MSAPAYRIVAAEPTPEGRAAFARIALPYLAKREALNNLQLGVLDGIATGGYGDAVMVAAEDAYGDLAALLLRTPPHPLLVASGCRGDAREALLAWLVEHDPDLPGMVGPLDETIDAARWWEAHTGRRLELRLREGVYRLHEVTSARRSAGRARLAEPRDRERVTEWLGAFEEEAFGERRSDAAALWASFTGGSARRLHLWETDQGEVVSLAGRAGRTPNGARIGPVYTPPALRGRGYAEALVAAATQRELDDGARQCFLYTDLDNGTSNALYERIGYVRIGTAGEFRLVETGAGALQAGGANPAAGTDG